MKYLARIYHTNKDKQNEQTNDFKIALSHLNKVETDIYLKVDWLHYTDLFFKDTNNYIRVNNKI